MNSAIAYLLLGVGILLPTSGLAGISEETVLVTGSGPTQERARRAALVAAVEQIHGLVIESDSNIKAISEDTAESVNSEVRSKVSFSDLSSDNISVVTRGMVSRYSIRDEHREQTTGLWTSELEVTCPFYRTLTQHLRALAVLSFHTGSEAFTNGADPVLGSDLARALNQKLLSAFTQSRRFRVLDRRYDAELEGELKRIRSKDVRMEEKVKLGQKWAADLLILGEIGFYHAGTRQVVLAGTSWGLNEARLSVHYEVVEVATQQARWADDLDLQYDDPAIRRLGLADNFPQLEQRILADGADAICTQVLDIVSPIKVLDAESPMAIHLNQGGNRVQTGQMFLLFETPRGVADPEHGLTTRVDGPEIASVIIEDIKAKYSTGRLLEGDLNRIRPGLVCRRAGPARVAAYNGRIQQTIIDSEAKSGKSPPIEISASRRLNGWQISVKNISNSPVSVTKIHKVVNGVPDSSSYTLAIGAKQIESFGLNLPFANGDSLSVFCDGFEAPRTYFFRP